MFGILFSLAAAFAWGASEFLGGLQSKSSRVLTVLWISSVGALLVGAVLVLIHGAPPPPVAEIWPAIPAGVLSVASLVFIYRAIAIGPAIVVLPTAAGAAVIPILWGFITGTPLSIIPLLACIMALGGSLLASGVTEFAKLSAAEKQRMKVSLPYALIASVLVGAYFILSKEASEVDPYWTVTIARIADFVVVSAAIIVVSIFRKPKPGQLHFKALLIAGFAGITDIIAELSYALASININTGIAAVVSSMYPAVTILLALLIWKEIPSRIQTVGLVTALIAVGVLSIV